jgi:glutaredoxin 3
MIPFPAIAKKRRGRTYAPNAGENDDRDGSRAPGGTKSSPRPPAHTSHRHLGGKPPAPTWFTQHRCFRVRDSRREPVRDVARPGRAFLGQHDFVGISPADPGYSTGVDELYQAEWCPYSRRVRQRFTELGVSFVARSVPAERADREELRRRTGSEEIPALVLEDGTVLNDDADEIIAYLDDRYRERVDAEQHRERADEHAGT